MVREGQRCLVFGGSGALGRIVCRTLASQGAILAFTYHKRQAFALELAGDLPGSLALPLDLSCVNGIERVIDEVDGGLGGIDAFVQCAAETGTPTLMAEVDQGVWDRMIDINVKSTFFAVRHLMEIMRRTNGGNIVLMGSVDVVKPMPVPVHYAASKAALVGMTRTMAKELGPYNIRVNLIAPGIMEDGASKSLPPARIAEYLKHCGFKRTGKVCEIANVVAWFALHNTYVTGQSIAVDGAL